MRYTITRALLQAAGGIALVSLKLLPRDHPARSFYDGRIRQARTLHDTVISPKDAPRSALARLVLAGCAVVALVSAGHAAGII